ncbi:MAG TPA: RIP metalloprotease RseP [Flavobacteriales bacterium]|jgi:regulator of sigma E protease|nr:RIP metalloprotease RseP [Salibacteraceae bacterium]HAS35947.1 RIP metalloprotease RseP [Flavobacteriales bacterium]
MEEFLIKATQLILSLSILVVLHELGHFIPAKLFKTRVEKFYLFFNPWFSLFKVKRGDTEYGIGWLPLGGYVKISGMIDESMDKEQMSKPPEPWEYRAKPSWQRLVIILGGVVVNFLLAFLIYAMSLFYFGEKYLPNDNIVDGVWVVDSVGTNLGLQTGDKIVSFDGRTPERFSEVNEGLLLGERAIIERNGEQIELEIPTDMIGQAIERESPLLVMPRIPFVISNVPDSSHNASIGLEPLDRVRTINGERVDYFDQAKTILAEYSGSDVSLGLERNGESLNLTAHISEEGMIGVVPAMFSYNDMEQLGVYQFETLKYGFWASFPAGVNKGLEKLASYWRQLSKLADLSSGAYRGLGSFGTMGKLFSATWNWQVFWEMTAFLSIILGLMNVLPIPALDGGHAMFIVIEMVSGRPPSQKVMEAAQTIGMVLLLLLMTYAIGNDIFRAFT